MDNISECIYRHKVDGPARMKGAKLDFCSQLKPIIQAGHKEGHGGKDVVNVCHRKRDCNGEKKKKQRPHISKGQKAGKKQENIQTVRLAQKKILKFKNVGRNDKFPFLMVSTMRHYQLEKGISRKRAMRRSR